MAGTRQYLSAESSLEKKRAGRFSRLSALLYFSAQKKRAGSFTDSVNFVIMVGARGFEPPASWTRTMRAKPDCATPRNSQRAFYHANYSPSNYHPHSQILQHTPHSLLQHSSTYAPLRELHLFPQEVRHLQQEVPHSLIPSSA